MKLPAAFVLVFLSFCSNADKSIHDLTEAYLKNLVEESSLDFKLYFVNYDYYEDGSIKQTNTVGFALSPNKSTDFKLSSLGTKKIGDLAKKAEDEGVVLSVVESNRIKNTTNTYDTKKQKPINSPASEIFENTGGYALGVLEQVFDTLYETKNEANITAYEFHLNRKLKKQTTMIIHAKEVMVKEKKGMGLKMVEESKKLLKKALKVDSPDKAGFIVHQFEERYPKYKWNVLINPVAYTCKYDVMISLKYENTIYTILGSAL